MNTIFRASPLIGVAFMLSIDISGSWRLMKKSRLISSMWNLRLSIACGHVAYPYFASAG